MVAQTVGEASWRLTPLLFFTVVLDSTLYSWLLLVDCMVAHDVFDTLLVAKWDFKFTPVSTCVNEALRLISLIYQRFYRRVFVSSLTLAIVLYWTE